MRIPPYFPRLGALALACALALPAQAAERAWSYSYNALGLIERADGPRTDVQDVTLYAYDSRGNLTQVTNALGQVTRLGDYDERGKPGSITDANGVTSSLAYTGVDGWLASVSTAGSTTRFDYDAVGQITRVTRGDGSWLSYEYDDARRLVAIGNNLGERSNTTSTPRAIAPPSASRTPAAAWCASSNGPTTSLAGCSVRSAPAARHAASPTTSTTIRSAKPTRASSPTARPSTPSTGWSARAIPSAARPNSPTTPRTTSPRSRTRAASPPATNTTASAT